MQTHWIRCILCVRAASRFDIFILQRIFVFIVCLSLRLVEGQSDWSIQSTAILSMNKILSVTALAVFIRFNKISSTHSSRHMPMAYLSKQQHISIICASLFGGDQQCTIAVKILNKIGRNKCSKDRSVYFKQIFIHDQMWLWTSSASFCLYLLFSRDQKCYVPQIILYVIFTQ